MRYYPYTYDGHAINDTTNYTSTFTAGVPLLPDTDPILIERSENWPLFAGKSLPGHEITLEVNIRSAASTIGTKRDELKAWFPTDGQTLQKLIVIDTDNSNKQWYLYVTPISLIPEYRRVTIILSVPDPYWRSETVNSNATWTVTASGQTQATTVGGNANARPTIAITPNNAKTGSYSYKRLVTIRNQVSGRKLVDYPIELTGGGWNTSTEVGAGRMQADADDLRVVCNDVEIPRFVAGANGASTKVWSVFQLSEPVTLLLSGNMGTGAITSMNFRHTLAIKSALKRLPPKFTLQIGNEYFFCSTAVPNKFTCTVDGRAGLGSTAASHSDGDTVYWIEHVVWVLYGNSSAAAPDLDTSKLPIFDTTNSTNTSWVYTDFVDADGLRSGAWRGSLISSASDVADGSTGRGTSDIYTATHVTEADPASVAGIQIAAYQKSGAWKAETASVEWTWENPCGCTTIASASGEKYRTGVDWPTTVALQRASGSTWANVSTQATPGSAASWTAWSIGSTALGATYQKLRLCMGGSIRAAASAYAAIEMTAITLTLDNTRTPSVTFGAQQNNYYLDLTLTNQTTGKSLLLRYLMGTAQTLTINCEEKTVTHSSGASARAALDTDDLRLAWFDLVPGSNTLVYTDAGTANVTVAVTWRDRNS